MFVRSNGLHELRVGLRDSVLVGLIVLCPVNRSDLSLTSYPTFKLCLHFPSAPLLEGVGATAADEHPCDRE